MGERSTVGDTAQVAVPAQQDDDPEQPGALPIEPAVRCDADGVIREVNVGAATLFRATSFDDLRGRKLGELLDGTDQVAWLELIDGQRRRVRVIRVPAEAGGSLVIMIDLGAPDPPHVAPAERRHLFQVQRKARMATWEHDYATGTTNFSPGFLELVSSWFGTAARVSSLLKRVHADDRRKLMAAWRRHLNDGEPTDYEFRVVLPDGAIRWVELHARLDPIGASSGAMRSLGHLRDITERKNTGDALAAERAKLVDAQRIAKIGSWTYDIATGQVTRSEVLLEMYAELGVVPDHDVLFGIHPRDLPEAERMRDSLLSAADEETIELDVRSVEGGRIFRGRGRAELGEDGVPVRLHGTVQDVTEARALENRIAEDRRRYSEAQQVAGLGSWEWVPEDNEVFWSEKIHALLGVPDTERSSYLRYLDCVHPEDRRWVDDRWQRLVVEGGRIELEHRVVGMDGVQRILRCHAAHVPVEDGPDRVIGTAQDVTEQRAMQSRMARTSQRFADLVAIAPVGIGLFDSDARVLHANDALCELLGRDLEKLRGMTSEQLMHPEEQLVHRASIKAIAAATADTYSIPQRKMLTATGRMVHCKLDIRLSVQDDGRHIWIVAFTDVTEQRKVADALRHQATHDELTGLPNRAAVNTLLGELLAADSDATNVAVLFCDIDNFKRVNDSLGHDAGDELLVALARRLEDGLSEECTAARLSGDEFVIICSDVAAVGGVQALATKVGALLRLAVPVRGQLVRASASIGAAVPTGDRVTGADLLRFADAAMFESKRRGSGRVSVADADLIATAERQMTLEGELRDALHSDGLELHFQPVVAADGAVRTAEALLRWPRPSRTIMPDEFLPIAEQGGLLRDVDRWVLRHALTEAADWPEVDGEAVSVAVNLSALLPGEPNFADAIADAIAESGIAPDRVVLELVETTLIDLPARGTAAMTELVEKGVRFAVDDFGTGYSSLWRLKEIPAQVLKVDRSFVAGVAEDPADIALTRAVVDMAGALGRSCVAEGVETAAQFAALRDVGVPAFQGWLFAKALPSKEFRALLEAGPLPVPTETSAED